MIRVCRTLAGAWCVGLLLVSEGPAFAQGKDEPRCVFLCKAELKFEPTWTIEHLASRHRIDVDGQVTRVPRERVFELIFAVDVETTIPRVGLTLEAIVIPRGPTDGGIRDNGIEIESELNVSLVDTDRTGGWVSSHVDIVDKFSPAETPRARSVYTHKLNLEWDTAFHVFNRLRDRHWLRNVELEVSLDYVATGLPRAGDRLGSERFVDRASPWSLSLVTVIPLAPLNP